MADLKSLAKIEIGKPRSKYPTKTTINLLYKEKDTEKLIFTWVAFGIFLVFLGFFTKYLVLDQIAKVNAAEAQYNQEQQTLAQLQQANADYDDVQREYSHYGSTYLNNEELSRQDRASMMKVIDEKVRVDSGIQNISISGNVATLTIEKTTLSEVSDVVASLEESPIVAYVSPSTAETNEEDGQVVTADDGSEQVVPEEKTVTAEISVTFVSPTGATASSSSENDSLTDQLADRKEQAEQEGMDQ